MKTSNKNKSTQNRQTAKKAISKASAPKVEVLKAGITPKQLIAALDEAGVKVAAVKRQAISAGIPAAVEWAKAEVIKAAAAAGLLSGRSGKLPTAAQQKAGMVSIESALVMAQDAKVAAALQSDGSPEDEANIALLVEAAKLGIAVSNRTKLSIMAGGDSTDLRKQVHSIKMAQKAKTLAASQTSATTADGPDFTDIRKLAVKADNLLVNDEDAAAEKVEKIIVAALKAMGYKEKDYSNDEWSWTQAVDALARKAGSPVAKSTFAAKATREPAAKASYTELGQLLSIPVGTSGAASIQVRHMDITTSEGESTKGIDFRKFLKSASYTGHTKEGVFVPMAQIPGLIAALEGVMAHIAYGNKPTAKKAPAKKVVRSGK